MSWVVDTFADSTFGGRRALGALAAARGRGGRLSRLIDP